MHVRTMTADDIDAVHELGTHEVGFAVNEHFHFWSRAQLARWITYTDELIVAVEDEKVIGFAIATVHEPTGKAVCENIAVSPEHRGQGLGSALLTELIARTRARGAYHLSLLVETTSEAGAFFSHHGFTRGKDFTWFVKEL